MLASRFFISSIWQCRNKAVAEGAIAFYLQHVVAARIAKQTYGVKCTVSYNPADPEHYQRRFATITRPSGRISVVGGFSTLLAKVSDV